MEIKALLIPLEELEKGNVPEDTITISIPSRQLTVEEREELCRKFTEALNWLQGK